MKAAIAYDGHADGWSTEDVQQVASVVRDVADVLVTSGFNVSRIPVRPGVDWLPACTGADVIVNLCEGIGGVSRYESMVAGALELTGIPMTGASARTIALCHRKTVANALLESFEIPVPRWTTAEREIPDTFPLPALVKPAAEDASVGIDQGSVVTSRDELAGRVDRLAAQFDAVLVQRYIHGREMAVGFLGDQPLPLSEIDFSHMPDGAWPILSFAAKWREGSDEDRGSQPVCPAHVTPELAERVTAVAGRAWRAVGGSGYGRVDLRVDEEGTPWVIEVNPNPDISPDAGLARMGRAAGMEFDDLIRRIVGHALNGSTPRADASSTPVAEASGTT